MVTLNSKLALSGITFGFYVSAVQAVIPQDPDTFLTLLENAVLENATTATAYYQAVDPGNLKDTYAKWLTETGLIASELDFTQTGPISFNSDVITVVHHNKVDLNFTRVVSFRCEPSCDSPNPDIYSTIENYLNFEDAASRVNRLAAVTMEWTSAADGSSSGSKFVTFYAYTGDGNRNVVNPATGLPEPFAPDLDGRGAKQVPGLCNSCHGGIPSKLNPDGTYPDNGRTNALFIPLDLDNFDFDNTPGRGLTRAEQEPVYKQSNKITLLTHKANKKKQDEAAGFERFPAGHDLIEGWYGGPGMPNDTFNGEYVPKGWLPPYAPASAAEHYLKSVAPACRACHIQREMSLDFGSYEGFMVFEDAHKDLVLRVECGPNNDSRARGNGQDDKGVMPLAKVTYERFWGLEPTGPNQADDFKELLGGYLCE